MVTEAQHDTEHVFLFSNTHKHMDVVVSFCGYFIRQGRKQDQWEFTVQAQLAVG